MPNLRLIKLYDVRHLHRVVYFISGIKILPQIHIEYPQTLVFRRPNKTLYCVIRRRPSLTQRTKTYRVGLPGQRLPFVVPPQIVPGHIFRNYVGWLPLRIEFDYHRTRWHDIVGLDKIGFQSQRL